ncbi:uncharacterized protein LOC129181875 isoform X3 [Dunckerocampus dactyliophorus]|uniref:uncharacterized protein LOC129181875 isoform X3 n=1 Tax=Dunckerocampus dactyliophorus TaxID=161453 RepID=UPI002406D492|nr:uncharacterized protein LOC129181875 isoform X3 [Dunckerocampus dactyliophorus]
MDHGVLLSKAIRREMGLQGMLSARQLKKKWDNMKEKYRALKNSPEGLQNRTNSWRWLHLMDEAMSGRLAGTANVVEPSVLDDDEDAVPHFSFAHMVTHPPELEVKEMGTVEGVPVLQDVFSVGVTEVCGDNVVSKTESPGAASTELLSQNGVLYATLLSEGIMAQSDNNNNESMGPLSSPSCTDDRLLDGRQDLERLLIDVERDRADVERGRVALERDRAALERDLVSIQRDRAAIERDRVCLDQDRAFLDRDRAFLERDRALLEQARALLKSQGGIRGTEWAGEAEVMVQTRLHQNFLAVHVDPEQLESTQRLVSLFQKLVEKL